MSENLHEVADAIRNAFGDSEYSLSMIDVIKDIPLRDNDDGSYTHIVDVVESLSNNTRNIANAITPIEAAMSPCPSGTGKVGSLTEAVMGLTGAMMQIASSIQSVADAIENK